MEQVREEKPRTARNIGALVLGLAVYQLSAAAILAVAFKVLNISIINSFLWEHPVLTNIILFFVLLSGYGAGYGLGIATIISIATRKSYFLAFNILFIIGMVFAFLQSIPEGFSFPAFAPLVCALWGVRIIKKLSYMPADLASEISDKSTDRSKGGLAAGGIFIVVSLAVLLFLGDGSFAIAPEDEIATTESFQKVAVSGEQMRADELAIYLGYNNFNHMWLSIKGGEPGKLVVAGPVRESYEYIVTEELGMQSFAEVKGYRSIHTGEDITTFEKYQDHTFKKLVWKEDIMYDAIQVLESKNYNYDLDKDIAEMKRAGYLDNSPGILYMERLKMLQENRKRAE